MFALATHSRVLVERMTELYVETAEGQGAKILAARVLVGLGGYLQKGGLASTSQRLFRRAAELDPTSAAAALALGVTYEQLGAYGRAIGAFESLIQQHPGSAEGLFRLAMTYDRMGNRRAAQTTLDRAAQTKAEPWLRSLIVQETARRELTRGRVEQALERMQNAKESSPGSLIWTAYLQDRIGRPKAAVAALKPLIDRPPGSPSTESPRKRYDGPPFAVFEGAREEVEEASKIRFDLLKSLVSGGAP